MPSSPLVASFHHVVVRARYFRAVTAACATLVVFAASARARRNPSIAPESPLGDHTRRRAGLGAAELQAGSAAR